MAINKDKDDYFVQKLAAELGLCLFTGQELCSLP